jgi:uncharacterized protein YodC (DUF2158 family)
MPTAGALWKEYARWQRLKRGMSAEEVRDLLGGPDRQLDCFWYYEGSLGGSGQVAGSIFFRGGRVYTITPPDFLAAHQEVTSGFAVGDLVKVKAIPGPVMTIAHEGWLVEGSTLVLCLWFDSNNHLNQAPFLVELLERASNEQQGHDSV